MLMASLNAMKILVSTAVHVLVLAQLKQFLRNKSSLLNDQELNPGFFMYNSYYAIQITKFK